MARDPADMHQALWAARPPVFSRALTDVGRNNAFRWEVDRSEIASVEDVRSAAERAKQSASGPGGIGYRLWAAEECVATDALVGVFWAMADEKLPRRA